MRAASHGPWMMHPKNKINLSKAKLEFAIDLKDSSRGFTEFIVSH